MPGLNFTDMNTRLQEAVNGVEERFEADLEAFDPATASSADMISLQVGMQKWSLATQLQTNTLKTVGDGLKSTVSNIR